MTITLYDMIREMERGQVFSLTVITFDRKRRTGGSIQEYPEARLFTDEHNPRSRNGKRRHQLRRSVRRPSHGKWFTRNIQLMVHNHPTGEIRKLHPPLVVKFNGKTVI